MTNNQQRRLNRIDQDNLCTAKVYQIQLTPCKPPINCRAGASDNGCSPGAAWVSHAAAKAPTNCSCPCYVPHTCSKDISPASWPTVTNAFIESPNSLFSVTKRKARGYRSTRYSIACSTSLRQNLTFQSNQTFPLPIPSFHCKS
ncbi:MAG: transposase [Verrucomicrobiales bacterium]|nr:transposase [Verrucomicrobiales bacterium]